MEIRSGSEFIEEDEENSEGGSVNLSSKRPNGWKIIKKDAERLRG